MQFRKLAIVLSFDGAITQKISEPLCQAKLLVSNLGPAPFRDFLLCNIERFAVKKLHSQKQGVIFFVCGQECVGQCTYMGKNLRISLWIRKPFLIYDFAPDLIWISLYYMRKVLFYFVSVWPPPLLPTSPIYQSSCRTAMRAKNLQLFGSITTKGTQISAARSKFANLRT